ncbi:hypothetical protein BHM03_00007110 [Ensete ventricosum]|nr:hypothetical protein BHM03_00007110 [Ensete ventricosum]
MGGTYRSARLSVRGPPATGRFPRRRSVSPRREKDRGDRILLALSLFIFIGSVVALGAIISAKPLDDLGYKGWNVDQNSAYSPYTTSMYLGWALASAIALMFTAVLPIVAWFATYRFSLSSAICLGFFTSK